MPRQRNAWLEQPAVDAVVHAQAALREARAAIEAEPQEEIASVVAARAALEAKYDQLVSSKSVRERCLAIAHRYVGAKDPHLAAECGQDAHVHLANLKTHSCIESIDNWPGFLSRVIRNRIIDYCKVHWRLTALPTQPDSDEEAELDHPAVTTLPVDPGLANTNEYMYCMTMCWDLMRKKPGQRRRVEALKIWSKQELEARSSESLCEEFNRKMRETLKVNAFEALAYNARTALKCCRTECEANLRRKEEEMLREVASS